MTMAVPRAPGLNRAPSAPLGRHFPAALCAATAGLDTFPHVAKALAIVRTFVADLGAFPTDMLVVLGTDQHEMR